MLATNTGLTDTALTVLGEIETHPLGHMIHVHDEKVMASEQEIFDLVSKIASDNDIHTLVVRSSTGMSRDFGWGDETFVYVAGQTFDQFFHSIKPCDENAAALAHFN